MLVFRFPWLVPGFFAMEDDERIKLIAAIMQDCLVAWHQDRLADFRQQLRYIFHQLQAHFESDSE